MDQHVALGPSLHNGWPHPVVEVGAGIPLCGRISRRRTSTLADEKELGRVKTWLFEKGLRVLG
jgi:hypothetical protein